MKLHFRKGAVVRFALKCGANLDACGKVVEVTDNEVVFVPQGYVSETEYDERWGTHQVDRSISVDELPRVHLDRELIAMWHYEPVPCSSRTTYFGLWRPSEIVNVEVNKYDEEGFCKGSGNFFE